MRGGGGGVGGVGGPLSGRHERQVSVDSGSAELDWSSEDGGGASPTRPAFVTVVSVGSAVATTTSTPALEDSKHEGESFVTVLAIGDGAPDKELAAETLISEKQVTVPTEAQGEPADRAEVQDKCVEGNQKQAVQDPMQKVPIQNKIPASDVQKISVPTADQVTVPLKQKVSVPNVQKVLAATDDGEKAASRKSSRADSSDDEDGDDERDETEDAADVEDVVVYRLPGERLGFGLRFEGGAAAHEPVRRLLVQSLAVDSPAGRATCAWGRLAPGDQLLRVDGVRVRTLTRLDCVRRLKEARVVVTLRVRRGARSVEPPQVIGLELKPPAAPNATAQAPPVPPRKLRAQPPPLPAECYLDVVGLEERAGAQESESDDTGSSLSTALERRSTANSSFSDALPPDPGRALERLEREIAASLDALLPPAEFKDNSPPDLPPRASPPPRERFRSGKRRAPPPPPPAFVEIDLRREVDAERLDVEWVDAERVVAERVAAERVVAERVAAEKLAPEIVPPVASRRQSVPEPKEAVASPAKADADAKTDVKTDDAPPSVPVGNATDSEEDEPISLDYSVLEELAVPPSAGVRSDDDDAPCWPEDAEFRVTAISTPGDVLFPSGWGAALPTILEEDAVVGVVRTENKPRLVVQPAEDVQVEQSPVEKTPVVRVPVEKVPDERVQSTVAQVAQDGGESLAKEATMEPPPPPFSRLPPDGHEFPARYEEDGFRFKPEPKPRRGQAEGTKSAPEVPARPSLDEPGTYRCKAEIELQVEAVNIVPSNAEELKTVPCREEEFRENEEGENKSKPNKIEDFRTMPSKSEKPTTTSVKEEEFKPVPNKEEISGIDKAEEFVHALTNAKDFGPVLSNAENYRKMTRNRELLFRKSKPQKQEIIINGTNISKPVPKAAEDFSSPKMDDIRTLPSKSETYVAMSSKTTDEFRPSKIEDFRSLPRKTAEDVRHGLPEDRAAASKPRVASWRSDERSDQSVRDKIAMFGRPSEAIESTTLPRRLGAQRPEAQESRAVVSSTLPRKPPMRLGVDDAVILRREQPANTGLHSRSHSLLDLSHRPLDELRRTSLAALVEQRRRGMSKLRGLVIPERSEAAPPAPCALDLPEIHSREEATLTPWSRGRSASLAAAPVSKPAGYGTLPALPKTSPPLSRKLPPFVRTPNSTPYSKAKETFTFSPKQDVPESVPVLKTQESWSSFAKPAASPPVASKPNGHHSVSSRTNGTSTIKTVSNGSTTVVAKAGGLPPLVGNPKGPAPMTLRSNGVTETSTLVVQSPTPATYVSFLRPQTSYVSTLRPTVGAEVNSDMPPPLPPSLPPARDDLDALPRDSGHSSASRTSSVDSSGGRVLAPRSLEALNRKSVLSSARHSSGRDLKVGSPQIQRKFSDSEDSENDADADSDSNSDEGDFCDEGAVECDDLVFFSGRDNPVSQTKPPPPPVRVAYITQMTDTLPELVQVNDGGRSRRLLVSGQPRAETQPKAKASLNDALKELIAPSETSLKVSAEKPKEWKQEYVKELAPREEVRKESVESVPKEQASKDTVEHIPKKQALKAVVVDSPKETVFKAPIEDAHKKQTTKVSVDKTATENISQTPKHKASKSPSEKVSNGHTQTSPKEQSNRMKTPPRDRISNNHPSKPPRDATPKDPTPPERPALTSSRDRRCVSVSEIHTAFQKAERMAHARGASLDASALDSSASVAGATLEVVLRRPAPDAGLGLALAGGADLEAKNVTVHKVLQGGAAARDGRLRRGDHVLSINGKATRGLTHAQSVAALKEPRMEVTLTVSRSEPNDLEPSIAESRSSEDVTVAAGATAGEVTVTLIKETVGLGFSLDGGRDSPLGDMPLTVKKLFLGGVAERSGLVREGDRVLRIGAWDTAQMSRLEAWAAMKRLPEGPVVLTIGSARP